MEVDNFKEFRKHLNFSKENVFYFCQIIQRKKDDNITTSSNSKYRRIKSFYISSLAYYDKVTEEIKELCKNNNARAYIRISPISFYDVALNTAVEYITRVQRNQTFKSCNIYDSCCSKTKPCNEKIWIIDYDYKDDETSVQSIIENKEIEILYQLPTKNGIHFIVKPFNKEKLKLGEIKSNNPITLLYYNDLSSKSK